MRRPLALPAATGRATSRKSASEAARRAAAGAAVAAALLLPATTRAQGADGAELYDRWCAGCHGVDGRGDGPAASTMLPRPRDFTLALYQIRNTATGELPTDSDILRVIDEGMPGTGMPAWADVLSRQERRDLVAHLKTFSRFFEDGAPDPIEVGRAPRASEERLARGRAVYDTIECWRCHGQAGRGDGPSAPTLKDDAGVPVVAADLTANWRFNGGGTVEDVYRRLRTGLDGTPMPTFSDLVDAGVVTDDDLWSLALYVRGLAPERSPEVREVVRAERVGVAELPSSVDDAAWDGAARFWIPLGGQIVVKPRWFAPRVAGLWIQALHDGGEVALLVSWTDPSASPDSAWAEFGRRVIEAMAPADEGAATEPTGPDRLVVQFPQRAGRGLERPYFLQGDPRRPAYLWRWTSDAPDAVEEVARGLGTGVAMHEGEGHLSATASHDEGRWRVIFRRRLDTGDEEDPVLPEGRAVPMAFQAWDGDMGEGGTQGAVSTWYFLALQPATPVAVFAAPPLALLLTFGLGLLLVRRAGRAAGPAPAPADPRHEPDLDTEAP